MTLMRVKVPSAPKASAWITPKATRCDSTLVVHFFTPASFVTSESSVTVALEVEKG